jgi:hypothetical protein
LGCGPPRRLAPYDPRNAGPAFAHGGAVLVRAQFRSVLQHLAKAHIMKSPIYLALAASLALSQVAISTASAETFRTAAPQSFSSSDMQRYGLTSEQTTQAEALQRQGYHVQVMTQAEAQRVYGGQMSTNTWMIIGVVALIVIAVSVSN